MSNEFFESAGKRSFELMAHQEVTKKFLLENPYTFDASDPGTGKTLSHLAAWAERRKKDGGTLLILAPKSLLEAAWAADLYKFFGSEFSISVAYARNRQQAFDEDADIYITNSDASKWLADQRPSFFSSRNFDELILDESTAYKNRTSKRSKAVNKIKRYFKFRRALSATPNSRSVTDIWHQIFLLDEGNRLGKSFFHFRNSVQYPKQMGPMANMVQWIDKEGAEEAVGGLLADITIRHKFEDCIDIPEHVYRTINVNLPQKLRRSYNELKNQAVLELQQENVVAVNAAVLANKLLQVASGSVYTKDNHVLLDTARYELTLDLVEEIDHSVVFFRWQHQKEALIKEAEKRGISYDVLDGHTPERKRAQIVERYQEGMLQVLFLQPQSAAHGITLTRGRRTIWCSPVYEPDIFRQGNGRIYRAGQNRKTETIMIQAEDTLEPMVYQKMQDKDFRMVNLLNILET